MESFVVGIDGGGSKTRAILADDQGKPITEASGAGSAVRPGEAEQSAGIIAGVVRDAAGHEADRLQLLPHHRLLQDHSVVNCQFQYFDTLEAVKILG